jgi:N-methylhydantoinase B
MTVPMTIADTIFKALAFACPENVLAGHHADLAAPRTFGVDPKTGRSFHFPQTLSGGGWGALHDRDGQNATFCINDGDTHNTPAEAAEGKGPILHRPSRVAPGFGRAGPASRRARRGAGGTHARARKRALGDGTNALPAVGTPRRQGCACQSLQHHAQGWDDRAAGDR